MPTHVSVFAVERATGASHLGLPLNTEVPIAASDLAHVVTLEAGEARIAHPSQQLCLMSAVWEGTGDSDLSALVPFQPVRPPRAVQLLI